MYVQIKRFFFITIFNTSLFILLVIGLQNNSEKTKVNLLVEETVKLPIGFIVGTSFISGSIIGSIFTLNLTKKK